MMPTTSMFISPIRVAVEQVAKAMVEFRDEHHHLLALVAPAQPPVHAVKLGKRLEARAEGGAGRLAAVEIEHDAHEEPAGFDVVELLGLENVSAIFEQQAGDRGDQAGAVLAGEGKDVYCLHIRLCCILFPTSPECNLRGAFCGSGRGNPHAARSRTSPRK